MDTPHGIIIFGANGSGKTTLGREVARVLDFKHMDIEDYYFAESEIPYTVERPREERLALMLADIEKFRAFVLTAVTGDFGDVIPRFYELGVFLSAPPELRLERVKQRSYNLHGGRVREGGDMYEQQLRFTPSPLRVPLKELTGGRKRLCAPSFAWTAQRTGAQARRTSRSGFMSDQRNKLTHRSNGHHIG